MKDSPDTITNDLMITSRIDISTITRHLPRRTPILPLLASLLLMTVGILIGGSSHLAQAQTAGTLDSSFGSGGKVITDFGAEDSAQAISIQADGKILVGGTANEDFAVARYNPNGSLDTTFGSGGKVTTDFGSREDASDIALQKDGKIIVVGSALSDFAVVRYNSNGSLDTTFGSGGKITTDFGDSTDTATAVAIQSDGKIVVAGRTWHSSATCCRATGDFALARYNTNGSLDASFDGDGRVITDFGTPAAGTYYDFDIEGAYDVVMQNVNGVEKIIVAGQTYLGYTEGVGLPGTDVDFALARYDLNGQIDLTFGTGGQVITNRGFRNRSVIGGGKDGTFDSAKAVTIQSDNKIVVAGYSYDGDSNLVLARYLADGALDPTFGDSGWVTIPSASFFSNEPACDVATQMVGGVEKIVAVGRFAYDFVLARFNLDGSPDINFGSNGQVTTDFGSEDAATGVAIQCDSKIVVAGRKGSPYNGPDFALARYESDPLSRPSLAVNDLSVTEGQSGTVNATFNVTLSISSSETVTVQYATANGTATAPGDYLAASGTLTFQPGETSQTIMVSVKGDTTFEPNETFYVNLSNASCNATIADSQGIATIVGDDNQPSMAITDVTKVEGLSGTTAFTFTVSLSNSSYQTVTVNYRTADGTAKAPGDYTAISLTKLSFAPGETSKSITVSVKGDKLREANETFFVNLSGPVNATLADGQGVGNITNDD